MSDISIPPFVVFSLPRSRSAWLSVLLSQGGAAVGHDIGIECGSPEDFVARLSGLSGTCETGAMFAWRLIRDMVPGVRFAVVRRDPAAVCASLARFGFTGHEEEIARRDALLDEIVRHNEDVFDVSYDMLTGDRVCRLLFMYCRGDRMDVAAWSRLDPLNIQVDMQRRLERLCANHDRLEALKADVAARLAHA